MKTRIMGVDWGMARIGVALSDEMKILASALTTVQAERSGALDEARKKTVERFLDLLKSTEGERKCTIDIIVIGMPLHLSGKKGELAEEITRVIPMIEEQSSAKIITWDERLTTVQVERVMKEANMSRKKRSKVIDETTATLILQNYLDSQDGGLPMPPIPPMP